MKIKIISVGKIKNKGIFQLCSKYKDRIKHFTKLEEVILKSGTNHSENEKIFEDEQSNAGKFLNIRTNINSTSSIKFAQVS